MTTIADTSGGFAIAHRKRWDHHIFRNKQEASVWAWMTDCAQWRGTTLRTKYGPVQLEEGEILIAEREVAEDFGMHRNTLRRLLQRMSDDGMIDLVRDRCPYHAGTIVRCVNYRKHQRLSPAAPVSQPPIEQRRWTDAGPIEDRSGTQNNTVNKLNTETKKDSCQVGDADADANEALFERFWAAMPKRSYRGPSGKTVQPSNPKEPARAKFLRLIGKGKGGGVDPEMLIRHAGLFAKAVKNDPDHHPRFTPMVITWLNQSGWKDIDASNVHDIDSGGADEAEPLWKTKPSAWSDPKNPPPWDDAPVGTKCGRWIKGSGRWVKVGAG